MTEPVMEPRALLEALLELGDRAELEIRVLSTSGAPVDHRPVESACCRVGDRIWVVLAPSDPTLHQSAVVAEALGRYRSAFLDETFVAPGVRDFIERQPRP